VVIGEMENSRKTQQLASPDTFGDDDDDKAPAFGGGEQFMPNQLSTEKEYDLKELR